MARRRSKSSRTGGVRKNFSKAKSAVRGGSGKSGKRGWLTGAVMDSMRIPNYSSRGRGGGSRRRSSRSSRKKSPGRRRRHKR